VPLAALRQGAMQALLIELAKAVEDAGGCLIPDEAKRDRLKGSKARNLLERLRGFEQNE